MPIIDSSKLTRVFERSYADETAISFSAIDCVLNGEKAVYASTELTTGRRMQSILKEIGRSTGQDLRHYLGADQYAVRIWNPNVEAAMAFARRLHHSLGGNQLVITPGPFTAPGWNQPEYLAFWETLIRTRIASVYFNDGWEYSNGCAFELRVALDAGVTTFDAAGEPLGLEAGIRRLSAAVATLHQEALDCSTLVDTLDALRSSHISA